MNRANFRAPDGAPDLGHAPLIVATSRALTTSAEMDWFRTAPGMKILIRLPDAQTVTEVAEDWFVFDFETAPKSSLYALCEATARIRYVLDGIDGHMLYLAWPGIDLLEFVETVTPWEVAYEELDTGECAAMVLGPSLAMNPLLADYLTIMRSHTVDTRTFTTLLKSALDGGRA